MRWLAAMLWVVGCSTPPPVPDVFSPAAHASNYGEQYRPIDQTLWYFGYVPEPDTEVMRYVVAPQIPDPPDPAVQPDPTVTYSSEGPWR